MRRTLAGLTRAAAAWGVAAGQVGTSKATPHQGMHGHPTAPASAPEVSLPTYAIEKALLDQWPSHVEQVWNFGAYKQAHVIGQRRLAVATPEGEADGRLAICVPIALALAVLAVYLSHHGG